MLAKAAAHASTTTLQGSVYLDSHDVKIIQYKAAIYKLGEMGRLLNILEKNVDRSASTRIIPLINYILSLCEGPLLNVHPVLRKRYQLLCEFRLCKVANVNPALSTSAIDLEFEFPQFLKDADTLRSKIYDDELQWKMLGCLQNVITNSSTIYERRLRQVQLERNAKRPTDSSGRSTPFNLNSVEDLLRPHELSLSLDLAVLINDSEKDTTIRSLLKLQTQVLSKFATCLQTKVLPVIGGYYSQLQKFSTSRGVSVNAIKDLQHWQYTLHRMYALMLRALYVYDVMLSLTMQIYLPNRAYLNDIKIKMLSRNAFSYQESLNKLESLCNPPENVMIESLISVLLDLSKQGTVSQVQPGKILELYQNSISKVIPLLRSTTRMINDFADMWKYIEGNLEAQSLIGGYEDSQLNRMFDERLAVDKLTYLENKKLKSTTTETGSPLKGSAPNSRNSLRRNAIERLNSSSSSSVSSSGAGSPGTNSPLRMSRTSSIDKLNSKPSSFSSPQVSRRGSIAESRLPNSTNGLAKSNIDQKATVRSPLSKRRVVGRPRSSSLQSAMGNDQKARQGLASPSRSNSLQADAAINQKIIQDAVAKSLNGTAWNSKVKKKTSSSLGSSKKESRSQSPSVDIEKLSLDSKPDQNKQHSDPENSKSPLELSTSNESTVCVKKVRFVGVPPLDEKEDVSPKRRGWYKKPAVLHYPPPPPQFAIQKYKVRQEGMAFRTSLREDDSSKKSTLLMNMEIPQPKDSTTQKIASKILDKLR